LSFDYLCITLIYSVRQLPLVAMGQEAELWDIAQAAAFLRVSETSLRRWTNAGRLPCFRVGGRRERRFRRADLLAFLERPGESAAASRTPGHLCGLYTSTAARERLAAGFLAEGLEAGSTCFLVAEPRARERVIAQLARRRPSVRRDIRTGRLVVSAYGVAATAQLAFWETRFAEATRAGARSLRVVGDVSDGRLRRRRPFAEVLAYEREYDRSVSRRFPVATLCLYDARRLSGVEASRVLQVHGDLFRHPVDALVS
jgi:excisionase family DNA binding protein